jgi:hypothetical protein
MRIRFIVPVRVNLGGRAGQLVTLAFWLCVFVLGVAALIAWG